MITTMATKFNMGFSHEMVDMQFNIFISIITHQTKETNGASCYLVHINISQTYNLTNLQLTCENVSGKNPHSYMVLT